MSLAVAAIAYAKLHKIEISRRLTDPVIYPPSDSPVTVFMAGSPGAGKTEYSKNAVLAMTLNPKHRPIRIDSDELRSEIPGYTGSNSAEVQGAVSILLREMYERTLVNKQSVVIDGTLANYEKAVENINRSLKRKREVFIFYIYQQPEIAWQFTLAREKVEGRNIPKDDFIDKFVLARETVDRIHKAFGDKITIFLIQKNYITNAVESINLMSPIDPGLDVYLPAAYTKEQLMKIL